MVIYEVNLQVDMEIAEVYAAWLREHVQEMLAIDGFEGATWYEVETDDEVRLHWCLHYRLKDRVALQAYFDGPAERMRDDGLKRFAGRFDASRRILTPQA